MVNDELIGSAVEAPESAWQAAERRVLLAYAPPAARAHAAALLALDDLLADVIRSTSQPLLGQMRLTWWHDALTALDTAAAPAHPVLVALSAAVAAGAATGSELAQIVEGWEELLEPGTLDDAALERFATLRGGGLFLAIGRASGATSDPLTPAGRAWALMDLAQHATDIGLATRARALAAPLLQEARARRWSGRGRMLGAMTLLAERDDRGPAARTARALWHRITGL